MTDIFLSYFELSLSIGVIVGALILLAPILNKRYAAKWKYLIWICLALRLLTPFHVGNVQPVRDIPLQAETQTSLMSEEKHKEPPAEAAMPPTRVIVEIPSQMTAPIAVQTPKSKRSISMLDIVVFVWMIGCLIFISVHLVSCLLYKRQVVRRGTVIEDTGILYQISELKQELHIKGAVRAIEYPQADSPMIIGFMEPVLVLPEVQYSPEELFFILKHELVHLKRKDVFFKLLFVAANAVHWFNPLIWVMQKEAAVDMELSCDERVTRGTDYAVRKAYTETLLSTIHKRGTKRTALSTQFYGGKRIMKKRFNNILSKNGKKNGIALLICAVILIASLGTLLGCTLVKRDTGAAPGQPGGEAGVSNIPSEKDALENESETKRLNDLYSDVKEYPVEQIVELSSDAENAELYDRIRDIFAAADLFSNDLDAENCIGPFFDIDLNEWGKVTFVTLKPEHDFYLLGNGKVLYQFPHVSDFDPYDVSYIFSGDINGDNKKELLIIFERYTGAVQHTKLCIYEDHGDEFVYNKDLSDEINENLPAGIHDHTGIYNWIYSRYIMHMDTYSVSAFDIMTFF